MLSRVFVPAGGFGRCDVALKDHGALSEASETSHHAYGVRFSDTLTELEFTDAVIVAVSFWVIVPDTTRNTPSDKPCTIVVTVGIRTRLVLVDSVTVVPPAGAAVFSFTVQ
jgi:hypothetical protein